MARRPVTSRPVAAARITAALVAALLAGAPALAQEAASAGGLMAQLDLPGGPPVAGRAFAARLTLTDAASGEAPRGLVLRSWVRPVEPGAPACTDAVRAFRATGTLPRGVVDLDAPVLAAAFSEGAVTLADPALAQARATLRKAWAFSGPPAAMVADPARGLFHMAFAATGEVVAMDASDGSLALVAEELDAPAALVPAAAGEGLWIGARDGVRFVAADGTEVHHGPGKLAAAPAGAVLIAGDAQLRLLDAATGAAIVDASTALPATALPVTGLPDPSDPLRPGALAWAEGAELRVLWRSGARQTVALGAAPDRLVADENGRQLYAIDSAAGVIAVVDLARGQVAEVIGDAGFAIGEALMTDDRLYLLAADASAVAVLNTRAAPEGPRWRRLALGPPVPPAEGWRQVLTATEAPGPVLAMNPVNGLVSEIDAPEALGNAPQMTGFALRGGKPVGLVTLDRRWREGETGIWHTRMALPAGAHEIVLTAGVGLTLCLPVTVAGDREETPRVALHLAEPPSAGDGVLRFRLEGGDALDPAATPRITVAALATGWRQRGLAQAEGGGLFALPVDLPGPGTYTVTPDLAGVEARSTTFEVR